MHVVGGDAERLGGDLAEHRERALAGFDRAGQHRRGAVLVDLHHRRARIGRDGEADRIPHAGDAASAPLHDRASQPKRSAALQQRFLHHHAVQHLAGRARRAFIEGVAQPDFERIDAERLGDVVHVRFVGEADLRRAEAAHRAGHRLVGVDDVGLRLARCRSCRGRAPGCRPCRAWSRSTSSRRRRRAPAGSCAPGCGPLWSRRSCNP